MEPLTFLPINNRLKKIVESIVIIDIDCDQYDLKREYQYPWTAKASIFFTLSDEKLLIKENGKYQKLPFCYTVGPRLVNDVINIGEKRRKIVGVTFKAGGFHRLMGIPVNLLTKENTNTHHIFGKETEEVEERLREAKNNIEILSIIESFLFRRIESLPAFSLFDLALEQCVESKGNIKIGELASISGLSIRQFERKCEISLAVAPKLFARLTRFTSAFMMKENNLKLNWSNIAYESGYFDQMHLIKDFRMFSGYNPNMMNQIENFDVKIMTILEGKYKYKTS
ncbi:hypothetical protein CEY12_01020 [Chryseobacterium sp. T16E-39]|uniref:helix-turn-helix domain-containing protein n=1 Tax=Chryseobacterium sp. T16E-39 TaxID=2015076 RepID=UPI000B5B4091|nr:AraC family transcriptional regulator [Chryseobacterium sp. T16E-39]ASK28778.1 hypothetical protein CEY12_01020 [Chryseobacterium sp. T16E-39]